MGTGRAFEQVAKLISVGGALDFGPEYSRLLTRVLRTLAHGRPVSTEQVKTIITDLGIAHDRADEFLGRVAERDTDGAILGITGLTLNPTKHRFTVGGAQLFTWCAEDALFLPILLNQTAFVESQSPASKDTIRLTVSPHGVDEVNPAGSVLSIVIVDPDKVDLSSVESTWTTFCHHIHFFVSRHRAEQWAADRHDIEILSVAEGFELGKKSVAKILAHAQ